MQTPTINAKSLSGAMMVVVAALGAGTYMGWTIEPETLSACKVDLAISVERLAATEERLEETRAVLDKLVNAVEAPSEP